MGTPGSGERPAVRVPAMAGGGDGTLPDAASSPARRRFDGLRHRIEQERALLRAWGEALPRWHRRYHEQAVPLFERREALDLERVSRLDHAHAGFGLGKAERGFLSDLIRELAGALAGQGRADLEPLLARHTGSDSGQVQAAADARMRQAVAEHFGLDPEDVDGIEVPEALLQRLRERERMRQAHAEGRGERRRAGKARRATAASPGEGTAMPLRELYRRLAAALHPDREPDPDERARKTALMQRLNQAYRAGSLLELIELQLEIGQLQPQQLRRMDAARIDDYNRDLERQLAEVGRERARMEAAFRADYGLGDGVRLDPARLDTLLARIKRQLADEIAWLEDDLRRLQDPAEFRRWLKDQRRQHVPLDDPDADG
ncbi:molecular chaperone DnaJ [Pseudoxanthomonas jiangsuensis]|uniref:J domain-containing protein n=1 Tax=Pseudoxanthomonas jiangsuensis TaxID=619688 RepID=UPI001390830E|nr:J domain-containing protein [Pseudoxanthomonas jiangsuensis]KAF1695231.1 molecular chaperone DnaJ [Pseudoxanthomonas jiangsuensis]